MGKIKVFKNGIVGLLTQLSKILFAFITRSLFIKYIGKELLGLNSTFSSVLSTLSLTELGFHTAVAFSLYKPIYNNCKEEINDIINIYKIIYRYIGFFLMVSSIAFVPFLKYIITGIEVDSKVHFYFLLQATSSACTYFLAYKKVLLYADQKEYITKAVDMGSNLIFETLQCFLLVFLKSYILYLIIRIVQTVVSNIIVHVYCSRNYKYLHSGKFNINKFREIIERVKSIFIARIAGYIYSSTDNIIISAFVSTVSVGMLVNYTTITLSLKTLTNNFLDPMAPIIGNYLVEETDIFKRKQLFDVYAHILFLTALCIIVPLLVLIDDFIAWWIGCDMVLDHIIMILIAADYYIHLVHGCLTEFINGGGYFKEERNVEIVGAVTNLVTSLILVRIYGVPGVLIGTVISQIVFWIGRSYIVFSKCFHSNKRVYLKYWIRNSIYISVFSFVYILCQCAYNNIVMLPLILKLIIGGILCEVICILAVLVLFFKMDVHQKVLRILKSFFYIGRKPIKL